MDALTHQEAIDAWRKASEQLIDTTRNGALTTREISDIIFGRVNSASIVKTRHLIRELLNSGRAEREMVPIVDITGTAREIVGFKLKELENEQ